MPPGENDPINLLALDGGGIRGVSELIILDKIMKRVQEIEGLSELPKPCDYFHIMGGVSTGGLVAILLGRFRMSTTEALAQYNIFAKSIFRMSNRRHFGFAISSKFQTEPLVNAVQAVAQEHGSGGLLRDPVERPLGKAFVCAMPNIEQGVARRFRTYASNEDWDANVEVWQAARATTAAPGYFEPMTIRGGGENQFHEVFIDAAMGLNNPADEVLNEAGLLFDKSLKLGCLLSLGTGTRVKTLKFAHGLKFMINAVANLKDIVTSSEAVHILLEERFKNFRNTYFRFSVPGAAETIPMDDYKKMKPLKVMTEEYLNAQAKERIEEIAQILANKKTENLTIKQATTSMEKSDVIVQQASKSQPRGQVSNFFTGRVQTLAKMHKYFFGDTGEESQRPRRREFLLWGMGGVGKSQVALKFYEDHVDKFTHRFWVDATNLNTLKEGYVRIGRELWPETTEPTAAGKDLINEGAANESLLIRVTQWMESNNQDWLLILDNIAADREWSEWLPRGGHARVIYTSREKNAKRDLRSEAIAEVNTLSEANAVTLLLRAADKGDHNDKMLRTEALPIVRELGCLPLALDQAGHYLAVQKEITLEDYLLTFKDKKAEMLRGGNKAYKGSSLLQQSVYTTFDISYTQLLFWEMSGSGFETSMAARAAIKILKTICFYYHENIRQSIFKRSAEVRTQRGDDPLRVTIEEVITNKGDKDKIIKHTYSLDEIFHVDAAKKFLPQDLERGLDVLQSLSLLKPTHEKGTYSMHVLVHDWARNRMPAFERQGYCLLARRILLISIPTSRTSPALIKYRRSVMSHAMACFQFSKENRVAEGEYKLEMVLQFRYALMAQEAADWEKAEEAWQDVLRDVRAEYIDDPEDIRQILSVMLRVAEFYSELARFEQAERLLVEALEMMEGEYGRGSEEAFQARDALKKLYIAVGRYNDAWEMLCRMVVIKKALGSAADLKKLEVYQAEMDFISAKIAQIDVAFKEEQERQLADPARQSRFQQYSGFFQPQPKRIVLEDDPSDTSTTTNNAPGTGAAITSPRPPLPPPSTPPSLKHEETQLFQLYSHALDTYGPDSDQTCNIMTRLISNLIDQRRLQCASIVAAEAYNRTCDRFGPHHFEVSKRLTAIAEIYYRQGNIPAAIGILMEPTIKICGALGVESLQSRELMMFLLHMVDVYELRRREQEQQQEQQQEQEHGDGNGERQQQQPGLLDDENNVCKTWCVHTDAHRELRRRLGPSGSAVMAARLSQYRSPKAWKTRERRRQLFKELLVKDEPKWDWLRESLGLAMVFEEGQDVED